MAYLKNHSSKKVLLIIKLNWFLFENAKGQEIPKISEANSMFSPCRCFASLEISLLTVTACCKSSLVTSFFVNFFLSPWTILRTFRNLAKRLEKNQFWFEIRETMS